MLYKSSRFLRGSLTAVISLVAIASAHAADNEVETVYVSATRSETAQLPVATQITVISAEEIRQSGAKLLTEILRTQVGIQLSDMDGSGMRSVTVSMRGFSAATAASNVLVLVDGRKLNNASQAAPSLNAIAVRDIERIEIVQGSAAVLYGDQAVSGVINVITRRARAGETTGSFMARGGSDNLEDYGVNLSQGFANGFSYSLSGQKRNADNYRDNNQSVYESALLNLRYDHEHVFLFGEGQSVKDDLRTPGSILDAEAAVDRRQTKTPNDFSNLDTDTWRVGGGAELTNNWSLLTEYSDRNEESEYLLYGTLTQASMRVKSITPRFVGNYKLANGTMIATLGYDQINSDYESNNVWVPIVAWQEQRSYYAQLVYPLLPKLTATIGVRDSAVEDKLKKTSQQNVLKSSRQQDDLNASELGISYQLSHEWRAFGRYAESFRFANPDDNNLVAVDVEFLKPQTGETVEVGTQWQGGNAQVSYALYQMILDDEIVLDPIAYANINLPDSKRQGVTLDADTRLSDEFALRFNYTYTDAEVVDGVFDGKKVPFVAEHSGAATVLFTPISPLTFSLETIHTGSRYRTDDENNSGKKLTPLTVFNLAAIYSYGEWNFGARINNITNELYSGYHATWGQYPQPERNYEASITYRF